ncbi:MULTISPECIES: MBL fold metallo-hydrolase [unclassified Corynebacterium]|uniref:MBL fold metallo-hydrolase n=1 Tax=unclassified Corynebacterium TaxID=2624378 RepID=UPI0021AAFF15|nr:MULTISPECIES: MBL fold metallo-hydrolase [unclassified Corynebacterium]MCT1453316.1 MBL fold metallo-hydrolase [Corynebacterium sp. p3-SID1145]MCT1462385.1 MBL fold metallo-hydrolase [Corynebacterium sp. p3-SID1140]MDN8595417.1 MBL fold metallo-hydrolase [Corynebacterium sp. P4_F2]WKK55505.1 MBL fold metallo-hydrolase [Corynebacterium sp. P4-C1]WKK62916.1 MBL fold metallo-hydrolase [Corynebacterium sp. P8-C1]
MKLTVLGCTGSLSAPGNPGTSYLVNAEEGQPGILMDFGPGALAALQEVADPSDAHLVFSHLHADHCSDTASLIIWRRFHPTQPARRRHILAGPSYAPEHLGRLGSDGPDDIDDISDTFDVRAWNDQPMEIGPVTVTSFPVVHPAVESKALRIEHTASGKVIAFSGDSAYTPTLIDAARNADLFLCEAAWGPDAREDTPEGMHMSGRDAGRIAREAGVKKLVLVHIQPWTDKEATRRAAAEEFDGEIIVGNAKDVYEV